MSLGRCDALDSIDYFNNEKKYRTFIQKLRQNYDKLKLTAPKRILQLSSIVNELEKTECALTNVDQTQEILYDATAEKELQDLAAEELLEARESFNDTFKKLVAAILARDNTVPSVGRDVVLEVNAGVGGVEAMLFCQELWNMYHQCALRNGWQFVQHEYAESELDGLRRGQALICPDRNVDAYSLLQHEAGIHRVQRVPKTEKAGRIHTSTVAVVVMLQPTEVFYHRRACPACYLYNY
ncbi:Peptide chain release factor [Trinorchestia longiramus]|nr:Peptide chain release factor [Trinorchestia longiramus]